MQNNNKGKVLAMSFAALGVVFGDIGTSPLYAVNELFFGHGQLAVTPTNVLGSISLVIWALTLIVAFKYLIFVLRADNDGEGGVFALYGLLNKYKKKSITALMVILTLAAGLLFGDGIITPAISVLSAVEGLNVATPMFANYIVPITIIILTCLFAIQYKGTAKIGKIFGPILILWFAAIAILGFRQVANNPQIIQAFNPVYGIKFLAASSMKSIFLILGAVMLAITGGEALYADMGHFGKTPIRISWFLVVFPALILNYLGQGALLLGGGQVLNNNIFYSMVPHAFIFPMVILATLATVIASQALISGAFSLTSQAIALGLLPRLRIQHTHHEHSGQIYINFVNWSLYIGCILLVLTFRSSSALASAYGLAVSCDMVTTSIAMMALARYKWNWNIIKIFFIFGLLSLVDLSFLTANSIKFLEGGFIPLTIGVVLFNVMRTWKWGRKSTFAGYSTHDTVTIKDLINMKKKATNLVDQTVLFMAPKPLHKLTDNTPALFKAYHERTASLPKNIIFVDVITQKVPYLSKEERHNMRIFEKDSRGTIMAVTINFGFMEDANVEMVLKDMANHKEINIEHDPKKWHMVASLEKLVPSPKLSLIQRLRLTFFRLLRRNSEPAYEYFGLGKDVQLTLVQIPVKIG